MDRQSGNACHRRETASAVDQHQHQGFEQEREARQLAGPIGPDHARDAAIGQLDARPRPWRKHSCWKKSEMSVALDDGVMDGMVSINSSHLKAAAAEIKSISILRIFSD